MFSECFTWLLFFVFLPINNARGLKVGKIFTFDTKFDCLFYVLKKLGIKLHCNFIHFKIGPDLNLVYCSVL